VVGEWTGDWWFDVKRSIVVLFKLPMYLKAHLLSQSYSYKT